LEFRILIKKPEPNRIGYTFTGCLLASDAS